MHGWCNTSNDLTAGRVPTRVLLLSLVAALIALFSGAGTALAAAVVPPSPLPNVETASGPFLYLDELEGSLVGSSIGSPPNNGFYYYRQSQHEQLWLSATPSAIGRQLTTPVPGVVWVTPGGADAWAAQQAAAAARMGTTCACSSPSGNTSHDGAWSTVGSLGYPNNQHLPSGPGALKRALVREWAHSHQSAAPPYASLGDAQLFELVGTDAIGIGASAAVQRALETLVSGLPGVQSIGAVQDEAGRSGVGFQMASAISAGTVEQLIFSPVNHRLLEVRRVQVSATPTTNPLGVSTTPPPVGTVNEYTTYLGYGVVRSTSFTPGEPVGTVRGTADVTGVKANVLGIALYLGNAYYPLSSLKGTSVSIGLQIAAGRYLINVSGAYAAVQTKDGKVQRTISLRCQPRPSEISVPTDGVAHLTVSCRRG